MMIGMQNSSSDGTDEKLEGMNSYLLTIKGREIARIVCKRDVSVNITQEVGHGHGPFNIMAPVYVTKEDEGGMGANYRITVSQKLLLDPPLQALRSFRVFVAHEASHIYLTDFAAWKRWHRSEPLKALIANLIEDHRCNAFLISRYPGMKRDFASYLAYSFIRHKNIQDVPRDLKFLTALVQSEAFGRVKGDKSSLTPLQQSKIETIMELLDGIKWSCLFDEELIPCAERIYGLVNPEQFPLSPPNLQGDPFRVSTDETVVETAQKASVHESLPERMVKNFGREDRGHGEKAYEEQVLQVFSKQYNVETSPTDVEKKLIRDLFGVEVESEILGGERRNQTIRKFYSKNIVEVQLPVENLDYFYKCRGDVLPQIQKLTNEIQLMRQSEDWDDVYKSGQTLAQDFAQHLLDQDKHIFRRFRERESDVKWLILTDVSSSVSSHEVTGITVLLSEVANAALGRNDFSMCAFSNNFYVVKDFNEGYDRTVKARIGGMYSGGTTNLCDGIELCINRFNRFPSETKVLVVVTDGEPNTCRKKDPENHTIETVRRAMDSGIFTIGIGTRTNLNVSKYFPVNFTISSLSLFPLLFKRILSGILFEPESISELS
jgi:hypothetical protein